MNLADLWPARLELEPLGGDERPGARWWPWAWAILRVSGVVAGARLWSRWYGGVCHVGEQDVGPTLAQDGDHRAGRRSSTPGGSPYRCPHPRGRHPALRGHRGGALARIRAHAVRVGAAAAEVPPSAGGVAFGRLTVQFKAGDTAYAGEQLDGMRAQFFASRPGDRPAARKPPGRACAASKWARRIRCLCGGAGRALVSGGAGGAARRTRFPRSRSGGRGCGRTRRRHRSRG